MTIMNAASMLHKPSSSKNKNSNVPRSVRWRIQMGLLELSPIVSHPLDNPHNNEQDDDERRRSSFLEYAEDEYWSMESIQESNSEQIQYYRTHYDNLRNKFQSEIQQQIKEHNDLQEKEETTTEEGIKEEEVEEEEDGLIISSLQEEEKVACSPQVWGMIEKDLNRLQAEHGQVAWSHSGITREERCRTIQEMLYIHSRHEGIPYQQGHHELASLILLAIEIDVFSSSIFLSDTDSCSPRHEDQDDGNGARHDLLDPNYRVHDAYSIFRALLIQLRPIYSGQNVDILSKLTYVTNDTQLYHAVQLMGIPQELTCARWMRLLFSRECESPYMTLTLWDIFWDLTSCEPRLLSLGHWSKYTRPNVLPLLQMGYFDWTIVLETTCASLLWMHRDQIKACQQRGANFFMQQESPSEMPPPHRLMATLLSSLRRIQYNVRPPNNNNNNKKKMNDNKEKKDILVQKDKKNNNKKRTQPPKHLLWIPETMQSLREWLQLSLSKNKRFAKSKWAKKKNNKHIADNQDDDDDDEVYSEDDDLESLRGVRKYNLFQHPNAGGDDSTVSTTSLMNSSMASHSVFHVSQSFLHE